MVFYLLLSLFLSESCFCIFCKKNLNFGFYIVGYWYIEMIFLLIFYFFTWQFYQIFLVDS